MTATVDPRHFRHVLGHFPTGVAAVTSLDDAGAPVGMIVSSFTSVSLSPPLVAFLPAKQSSTSPKIVRNGRFCVNVLGAHQESVSRSFAAGTGNKFDDLAWSLSPGELPRLDAAVAWIECTVEAVHDAGDHDIVVGLVTELEAAPTSLPLLFFQGGYGRFAPMSLAAAGEPDLVENLRLVDVARPFMEQVAAGTGAECHASSVVGDEIVLLASAGKPADHRSYSRVGQRLPLVPPLGATLVAWSDQTAQAWLARAGDAGRHDLDGLLGRVRDRGWSVTTWSDSLRTLEATVDQTTRAGLTPHARRAVRELVDQLGGEHEIADLHDAAEGGLRSVSVPVLGVHREVVMQLTLSGLPSGTGLRDLDTYLRPVRSAATDVAHALTAAANPALLLTT